MSFQSNAGPRFFIVGALAGGGGGGGGGAACYLRFGLIGPIIGPDRA